MQSKFGFVVLIIEIFININMTLYLSQLAYHTISFIQSSLMSK